MIDPKNESYLKYADERASEILEALHPRPRPEPDPRLIAVLAVRKRLEGSFEIVREGLLESSLPYARQCGRTASQW
jgi:hypothetical protein